jgi:hypothetical protein
MELRAFVGFLASGADYIDGLSGEKGVPTGGSTGWTNGAQAHGSVKKAPL